jgi:hypothetical protein
VAAPGIAGTAAVVVAADTVANLLAGSSQERPQQHLRASSPANATLSNETGGIVNRLLGTLLLLVSLGSVAHAQQGVWVYLGQSNVDGARDHDDIRVTRSRGIFRAIQIHVEKSAIEFDHVIVHYGNGTADPIQIRSVIPAGGQTRQIDLPGGRRVIQSVEFYYARANFNGRKPKVRLFGLH